MTSQLHRLATAHPEDLGWDRRPYKQLDAYQDSKLDVVLFWLELQRRLTASGSPVRSVLAHPGIARTALAAHASSNAINRIPFLLNDVERGALPTLFAATEDIPGNAYVGPRGLGSIRGLPEAPQARPRRAGRRSGARGLAVRRALHRGHAGGPRLNPGRMTSVGLRSSVVGARARLACRPSGAGDQAQRLVDGGAGVGDGVQDAADLAVLAHEQGEALEPVGPRCAEGGEAQRGGEVEVPIREQGERQLLLARERALLVGALGADADDGCTPLLELGESLPIGDRLEGAARGAGDRGPRLRVARRRRVRAGVAVEDRPRRSADGVPVK